MTCMTCIGKQNIQTKGVYWMKEIFSVGKASQLHEFTGRLHPEVQRLLYSIFDRKGTPFIYIPYLPTLKNSTTTSFS